MRTARRLILVLLLACHWAAAQAAPAKADVEARAVRTNIAVEVGVEHLDVSERRERDRILGERTDVCHGPMIPDRCVRRRAKRPTRHRPPTRRSPAMPVA